MYRKIVGFTLALTLTFGLTGCGNKSGVSEKGETVLFTDSCGREVELPKEISKVAPSGAVAQMILTTIAPDLLVGLSATPSSEQSQYLPDDYMELPTFGQFYGTKANLNMEALIAAEPQVIIDLGDRKENHDGEMDAVQRQTGIPTIFIETSLGKFADAYRTLGALLHKEEKGETLALYCENLVETAEAHAAKIPEDERLSVMYATGSSGLNGIAEGSIQGDVIGLVGAINACVVEAPSDSGMGNPISMEQLYLFDPDVIVMSAGGPFSEMGTDKTWGQLTSVKNGTYYEIPNLPYNWMSNPPSLNRLLGIWWLGNLLYPDVYDYSMTDKAKEFFRLFWDYELSDEEAAQLLRNSTLKRDASTG
jgi:iron complex transport system substrate-binding protein